MKKSIIAVIAMLLSALTVQVSAQGIIVVKTNGTEIKVPYTELNCIKTYQAESAPEEDEPVVGVAEAVDLGLTSGTIWASSNIGATAPEEIGNLYAWGETTTKESYLKDNYAHYDATTSTYINIGENIVGTQYDAAHVIWGNGWKMPTEAQCKELINECTWEFTTLNGANVMKITSKKNSNFIYIPAKPSSSLPFYGYIWTSNPSTTQNYSAKMLQFVSTGGKHCASTFKHFGNAIRPVKSN